MEIKEPRFQKGQKVMYDSYGQWIIYFDSEEKAKEIIKTIGEDRLRKYIFEVDE